MNENNGELTYPMTNAELEDAIAMAFVMVRKSSPGLEQAAALQHFKGLLDVQIRRARQCQLWQ